MDPVCHTLVGVALARAGLGRRTPLATATLVLGANAPDVDAVTYLLGDSLLWRRGATHGVAALVAWPFVLTAAMLAWDRVTRRRRRRPQPRPASLLALSALAVTTHPTLDFLNNYGLRWLMPFDGRWFYGDALFIVDPWIWAALTLGITASWWLTRHVARPTGGRPAGASLAFVAMYAAAMLALGQTGRDAVRAALVEAGQAPVRDPMVAPLFADVTRRYVVADLGREYLVAGVDVWPAWRLTPARRIIPRGDDHPAVPVAQQAPAARGFAGWARFPFFRVQDQGEAYLVTMDDARYAPASGRSWAAVDVRVPKRLAGSSGPPRRGEPQGPGGHARPPTWVDRLAAALAVACAPW